MECLAGNPLGRLGDTHLKVATWTAVLWAQVDREEQRADHYYVHALKLETLAGQRIDQPLCSKIPQ